ncbi:MAG: DUF3568 family protein, partial [Verrucomicrobia bacterium]|nr:DUF3568 family protein [Verrucomicrobiota bacterium]
MKRILCLTVLVLSASILFTGCALLVVGAAGAGGVAYVRGELKVTESVPHATAVRAAAKALSDLKISVLNQREDGLTSLLEARTSGDKKVTIKTRRIAEKSTEISI